MTTKNIRVHAILKTLSPLHIAAPGDRRFNLARAEVTSEARQDGVNIACTGIQRYQFADGAVEGIDFKGVPVIMANNFAGNLRRKGTKIECDALRNKQQQIVIGTYSALSCGAVTGKPAGKDLTYAENKQSQDHAYVGLFGGGPRLLRKKLLMHNILPVMTQLRDQGFTIPHPGKHGTPTALNAKITGGVAFRRGDDIRALMDVEQMENVIADFQAAFALRQAAIIEDTRLKDIDESGKRTSTTTFSAYEFVLPGVDFDLTLDLNNVTDAQIGLLLLALEAAAQIPIGGIVRNGLGRFSLNDVVLVDRDNPNSDPTEGVFNCNRLQRSVVQQYLDAWEIAIDSLTGAELDEIMALPPEATDEQKAAKAEAKLQAMAAKTAAKAKK